MNLDATNQFVLLSLIGFTISLVGGLNVLLRSKSLVKRFSASLLTIGLIHGLAIAVFPEAKLIQMSAAVMLGALPILYFALSQKVRTFTVQLITQPLFVWGLVTTAGLTLGGYSLYQLDVIDEQELAQGDLLLSIAGRPDLKEVTHFHAWTDTGKPITLHTGQFDSQMDRASAENNTLVNLGALEKIIRREAADEKTNCHGWVFTAGQYWIDGQNVELILKENGYQPVAQPLPGDIVIYRDHENRIAHTAIVRSGAMGGTAIVEGKWGWMGVFLHLVEESPYGKNYTFYRSPRKGHLIAGLGSKDKTQEDVTVSNQEPEQRQVPRY